MATAVIIQIKVDSAQAKSALSALENGMKQAGVAGEVSMRKAGDGLKSMGGHVATGLDAVRLLSQEFGLRLPRAIEAMLSRMPAITAALGSMLGVMAGIAAAQVFVHLAEETYHLYQQYISLNAEADKFYATLKKAQEEDFSSTRNIETTKMRNEAATEKNSTYENDAKNVDNVSPMGRPGLGGWVASLIVAHQMMGESVKAKEAETKLTRIQIDQERENALLQIEAAHASDYLLGKQQQINAETAKTVAINKVKRETDARIEKSLGNPAPKDAGSEEEQLRNRIAAGKGSAESLRIYRAERDQRIILENSAINAALEGEAKFTAEKSQAIAAIVRKFQDGELSKQAMFADTAAVALKFDNEQLMRINHLTEEAARSAREAARAGLEGAPAVAAGLHAELGSIEEARKKAIGGAGSNLSPDRLKQINDAFDSERSSANLKSFAQRKKLDEDYTSFVQSQVEARTEAELKGFGRIDAMATKAHNDARKRYDKEFVRTDSNGRQTDYGSAANKSALAAQNAMIDQDAAAQRIRLSQEINQQTLQMDKEAAQADRHARAGGLMGWVQDYRNSVAEIQSAHEEMRAKIDKEQADNVGVRANNPAMFDQYEKQKIDSDRIANAQIAQQNQQMQHQIAGDLQQAFTNPVDFIKNAMEKMFFEIIASWVMRMETFKSLFGTTMGGLQPGSPTGATGHGGFMNTILHGTGGAFGGHPSVAQDFGTMTPSGTQTTTSHTNANSAGGTISSGDSGTRSLGSSTGSGGFGSVISAAGDLGRIGGMVIPPRYESPSLPVTPGFNPSASIPGLRGASTDVSAATSSIPSFDDSGLGPEMQASSDTDAQLAAAGASSAGTASMAMGVAGAGMGVYTGVESTVNAFETDDPLKGALGDAAAGAAIGSLGGPLGTAIGAGVGAALGASAGLLGMITGEGGKLGARSYYRKNVLPSLEEDLRQAGAGDFQTTISDANRTAGEAMAYMSVHFGSDAAKWVNDQYMSKELHTVTSAISNSAEGGRQFTTLSASQFHTGGRIDGFGSFATSHNEGFIHAMMGETVMNTQAASSHGPMLHAMNSGASASDIAGAYLAASTPKASAAATGGDTHHHFHVHTLDTKTMSGWLRGGGAQMITKHQNDQAGRYSGDGIDG